ncbi:MAG TPA: glutamate decarboxylase [Candidatus Dormibacteraeota bacterium]|nr:glutamate decarboxylase [Candidatus Dormibacteraeota bacterium]
MQRVHHSREGASDVHAVTYAGRYFTEEVPKYRMPAHGMPADAALQLVRDELSLDGNPALNLASFVTTWMEPQADQLSLDTRNKNLIDQDEYPETAEIHERVVSMLGHMLNAPRECTPVGTSTVGSSEAIMLGLLAHKRAWANRRRERGLPADRPNLVFGGDVHTCWEKFTRYFEVEERVVPMAHDRYVLDGAGARAHIDENTIAIGAVVGTTYTGQMDDVAALDALSGELEREHGWRIPIHVDAASGGFILPFTEPEIRWDFRLEHVRSINLSNHKYGLVYPGMGTVVFRDRGDLPEELVFHITYLGGDMPNYSLNFSRPSTQVTLQYYNLLRLGREGYTRIMSNIMANAHHLRDRLLDGGRFDAAGDGRLFPVVALRARDPERLDLFALSKRLRQRGWIVPAYPLPANAQDITVLRVVVRENLSRDMCDMLVADVDAAVSDLCGPGASRRPAAHGMRRKDPRPVC